LGAEHSQFFAIDALLVFQFLAGQGDISVGVFEILFVVAFFFYYFFDDVFEVAIVWALSWVFVEKLEILLNLLFLTGLNRAHARTRRHQIHLVLSRLIRASLITPLIILRPNGQVRPRFTETLVIRCSVLVVVLVVGFLSFAEVF